MAAHRYWRFTFTSRSGSVALGELTLRATPGGADLAKDPTRASAGSEFSASWVAGNAFDGLSHPGWSATQATEWLKYDFGLGTESDVQEIVIQARDDTTNSTTLNTCPGSFKVEWSDDDSTWTEIANISGIAAWTRGLIRTYDLTSGGDVLVYALAGEVIHEGDAAQEVQFHLLAGEVIHSGDPDQEVRIYSAAIEVIRDLRDLYSPEFIENTPEVFDFSFTTPFTWAPIGPSSFVHAGIDFIPDKFTIEDRERNPYPAHPDRNVEVFLDEQQRTIREQHNVTQAGDSTFDYGLLLKGTPERQFTLGSLGRFYHDRYGIILARYVRFKSCVETERQGAPVGYLSTSRSVDWTVTNDFTKSDPDQVVGVMCLLATPEDDTYGWVITDGACPVDIGQTEGILPAPETPYVWSGTGTVDIGVSGKILGRRWGLAISVPLTGGTFYVRLEGMNPKWFSELIAEELGEIAETLIDHENRLNAAEEGIESLGITAGLIRQDLTMASQRITTEEQARARDVASIRQLLGSSADWSSEIAAAANAVRAEFATADDTIRANVATLRFDVDALLVATNGLDFAGVTSQLSGINSSLANIYSRLENFNLDWAVPADGQILVSTHITNADGNDEWFFQGVTLTAAIIPFVPAGTIAATNVQAALEELDSEFEERVRDTVAAFLVAGTDIGLTHDDGLDTLEIEYTGSGGGGGGPTKAFHVYLSTALTPVVSSETPLNFDTETFDFGDWFDSGISATDIIIPSGVDYASFTAGIYRSISVTGQFIIRINRYTSGGVLIHSLASNEVESTGGDSVSATTGIVAVTPGDIMRAIYYAGGAGDFEAGPTGAFFSGFAINAG